MFINLEIIIKTLITSESTQTLKLLSYTLQVYLLLSLFTSSKGIGLNENKLIYIRHKNPRVEVESGFRLKYIFEIVCFIKAKLLLTNK